MNKKSDLVLTKTYGSETLFLSEILDVIDRYSPELTTFQMLGALVSAARELLNGETEN